VITIKFKKVESDVQTQEPIEETFLETSGETDNEETLTKNEPEQKPAINDTEAQERVSIYKEMIETQ
jgi:hypothetical protein